jgi:hypothetical protein
MIESDFEFAHDEFEADDIADQIPESESFAIVAEEATVMGLLRLSGP